MADETTILQQLQHNWQTISATVSASLAGMWALMRSNVSRLEKLEEEMKGKASQTELNTAISSVRSEIESTRKELKSDLQTAKKEIRDDIQHMSDNINTHLTNAVKIAELMQSKQ